MRLEILRWLLIMLTVSVGIAQAAETETKVVEIPGKEAEIEEVKVPKPKKIEVEEGVKIPEVPPTLKEGLSPAEKTKLSSLEQKRAEGKINELQYEVEKDSIVRESNIKY